jgi:hypothetical protein
MANDRIERMREFVARSPEDARARYFLASELFKVRDFAGAAKEYAAYFALGADDEGYGYRSHAECLFRLGRHEEGRESCRKGIEAALRYRHDGLADEIRSLLDELGGGRPGV